MNEWLFWCYSVLLPWGAQPAPDPRELTKGTDRFMEFAKLLIGLSTGNLSVKSVELASSRLLSPMSSEYLTHHVKDHDTCFGMNRWTLEQDQTLLEIITQFRVSSKDMLSLNVNDIQFTEEMHTLSALPTV